MKAIAPKAGRIGWRREFASLGALAGLGVALAVAACTTAFGPRTVDVPQARLQELIGRRFPIDRRLLDAIDFTVDSPRLTLQPETNRIAVELALRADGSGVVAARMTGSLVVSEGLRFEPSDNTVRLVDARVERFAIDGLPGNWQRQLDRLGKPLARALLDEQVLYALRPRDVAALEGRGVRPGDLRVTATGLTITLLPIER
ncbi:MAG: hypothetical protein ACXWJ1_02810 [Caldimonas sp.]